MRMNGQSMFGRSRYVSRVLRSGGDRPIYIKTPADIEIMREAGRINAEALTVVRKMISPGVTTEELDKAAEEVIRQQGGVPAFLGYPGPYPYPATLTVSINEELVHGIPSKRKLKSGDIVSVDCGTKINGFIGDSAFTVGVGQISDEARRLIEVTKQALLVGISQMIDGNRVGDVAAAIQECVEAQGYHVPREYTGHGVGRYLHEGPTVPNFGTAGRGIKLSSGMTIALEPMVLIGSPKTQVLDDQWTVISAERTLTAHYEHTILITDGEPEILTLYQSGRIFCD